MSLTDHAKKKVLAAGVEVAEALDRLIELGVELGDLDDWNYEDVDDKDDLESAAYWFVYQLGFTMATYGEDLHDNAKALREIAEAEERARDAELRAEREARNVATRKRIAEKVAALPGGKFCQGCADKLTGMNNLSGSSYCLDCVPF